MTHPLDRPIWGALSSRHADLAEGDGDAKRYPASISAFAAARDDSERATAALAGLAPAGGTILLLQAGDIALPRGLEVTLRASGVQMIAEQATARVADDRIRPLGHEDARDMLDLATLTKPGPFSINAQRFGRFWGIRENGRLVAMAGERLKLPGLTELSGVCTHPDVRGRGLAKLMSLYVAGRIEEAGETPFLHAYASNAAAIGLYESLGFRLRSEMSIAFLQRGA